MAGAALLRCREKYADTKNPLRDGHASLVPMMRRLVKIGVVIVITSGD